MIIFLCNANTGRLLKIHCFYFRIELDKNHNQFYIFYGYRSDDEFKRSISDSSYYLKDWYIKEGLLC